MAELADAADSKSAGTWYLGGSTPPPGTTQSLFINLATEPAATTLPPISAGNVVSAVFRVCIEDEPFGCETVLPAILTQSSRSAMRPSDKREDYAPREADLPQLGQE